MNAQYILFLAAVTAAIIACSKAASAPALPATKDDDARIVVERLTRFLALGYTSEEVMTAYDEYYSKHYKDILRRTRNVHNAVEYLQSNPSVDFELVTRIKSIRRVTVQSNIAAIEAVTTVYDLERKRKDEDTQTFVMIKEDGRWVCRF